MRVVLIHEYDHQSILDESVLCLPGAKIEATYHVGNSLLFFVSGIDPTNACDHGDRESLLYTGINADEVSRAFNCSSAQCEGPMIEIRWVGRQLQFRQRAFQVDAAGAFCGVTDFDEWQTVPEQEIDEATLLERDEAEAAADRLASLVLGEDIDWPCHDFAWKRAIEKLEPSVRPVAAALPCEHCGRDLDYEAKALANRRRK